MVSRPGSVQFKRITMSERKMPLIGSLVALGVLILLPILIIGLWCHFNRREQGLEQRFQKRWAEQEKCVARAFKQGMYVGCRACRLKRFFNIRRHFGGRKLE